MMDLIRDLVKRKKEQIKIDNSLDELSKNQIFKKLDNLNIVFKDDLAFLKLDFPTAVSILDFLDIPENQILETYNKLIASSKYNHKIYTLYELPIEEELNK